MQRGGGEAAPALLQTTTGAADRLSVAAPGRCPVQRARQDAQRRTACVNAGLHGPGVVTRTGAGKLLLHLPARGLGGVSGETAPHNAARWWRSHDRTRPGVWGERSCPRMNKPNTRSDHAAKGEGATLHQPRFAAPHRQVMDVDVDLVAVFTRKGARHNRLLCEPAGRAVFGPAHLLRIRRRYVTHRHITTAAGDHTSDRRAGAAFPQPNAPATARRLRVLLQAP